MDIFGHGEGAKTAIAYGVPVLGGIEIDPRIRVGGDTGKPVAALGEEGTGAKSLYSVARAVANRLEEVAGSIGDRRSRSIRAYPSITAGRLSLGMPSGLPVTC